MIIFQNKGLLDIAALTTMGVSVKRPGSFGYFGTGLKFSIATILREGGSISIQVGPKYYLFSTQTEEIRGQSFDVVVMNGERLGFTTQLGKNWKPWMVLRELACNALDEVDGRFSQVGPEETWSHNLENQTSVQVAWDALEDAYRHRAEIFCDTSVLTTVQSKLEVRSGTSSQFYYRGVKVYALEKASRYTYNILADQMLTEDRTLQSTYSATKIIRNFWRTCEDKGLLSGALIDCEKFFEGQINYETQYGDEPLSKAFVDVVMNARQRKEADINRSALEAVMALNRQRQESTHTTRIQDHSGPVPRTLDFLVRLGINVDVDIVVLDELPGDLLSLAEHGRIYLRASLVNKASPRKLASEILCRFLDLRYWTMEEAAELLVPLLLKDLDAESPKLIEQGEAEVFD